jgi:hypothetical protein
MNSKNVFVAEEQDVRGLVNTQKDAPTSEGRSKISISPERQREEEKFYFLSKKWFKEQGEAESPPGLTAERRPRKPETCQGPEEQPLV